MALTMSMIDDGPAIYYDAAFRNVLEDHMTILRNHSSTSLVSVTPGDAYHYNHNLFGLLQKMNVPTHLHWLVMRVNYYTEPRSFDLNVTSLLFPDPSFIQKIQQSFSSGNRIS